MSYYSISAAAQELDVQRQTLYTWIAKGFISAPKAGVIAGSGREFWTEQEMNQIRDWMKRHYRGRGLKKGKRRKGKGSWLK
jgi:predicted site-specific integrase-resolvase